MNSLNADQALELLAKLKSFTPCYDGENDPALLHIPRGKYLKAVKHRSKKKAIYITDNIYSMINLLDLNHEAPGAFLVDQQITDYITKTYLLEDLRLATTISSNPGKLYKKIV